MVVFEAVAGGGEDLLVSCCGRGVWDPGRAIIIDNFFLSLWYLLWWVSFHLSFGLWGCRGLMPCCWSFAVCLPFFGFVTFILLI